MSDACSQGCAGASSLFPQSTFQSAGLSVSIAYGDSSSGTFAAGLAGTDGVDLAGITLKDQTFAAMNRTNTSLTAFGATGILGLGYPANRFVFVFLD